MKARTEKERIADGVSIVVQWWGQLRFTSGEGNWGWGLYNGGDYKKERNTYKENDNYCKSDEQI